VDGISEWLERLTDQQALDLLLALLRRRPAEDTGISMQGDAALWRSWLALTPL